MLTSIPQGSVFEDGAGQKSCEMNRTIKVSLKYLLYLPKEYEKKSSWPLMLFLHGSGERGNDLDLVKQNGPPKLIAAGKEFPFIVVSPQCPDGQWWEPLELATLLDEIVQKYKVDRDRIYLTGLSMGGYGTWSLALYQPHRFAALAVHGGGRRGADLSGRNCPYSGLGLSWGEGSGGASRAFEADGRRFEIAARGREIHDLSRRGARLLDENLRQPSTLRVVA